MNTMVSTLVLLDAALRLCEARQRAGHEAVSILVLMDAALRLDDVRVGLLRGIYDYMFQSLF